MKMIVGGAFQGKLDYTLRLSGDMETEAIDGNTCPIEAVYEKAIIYNFHQLLRRMLEKEEDISSFAEELILRNPDLIMITDEIGCGIVPMEKEERLWREAVGRVCCQLAGKADEVHRVICGVGSVIKEQCRE